MGEGWQTLVICAMGLSVALLTMWRGWRSPLALPFGLLMLDLTTWNVASTFYEASGRTVHVWHLLDNAVSPFSMPLGLHFALAVGGRIRSRRPVLLASYMLAACLGLGSFVAFFFAPARAWVDEQFWKVSLVLLALVLGTGLPVLVTYFRQASSAHER